MSLQKHPFLPFMGHILSQKLSWRHLKEQNKKLSFLLNTCYDLPARAWQPGALRQPGQTWGWAGKGRQALISCCLQGTANTRLSSCCKSQASDSEKQMTPFRTRKVHGFPWLLCTFPLNVSDKPAPGPRFRFLAEACCFHVPSCSGRLTGSSLGGSVSSNHATFSVSIPLMQEYPPHVSVTVPLVTHFLSLLLSFPLTLVFHFTFAPFTSSW